MQWIKKGLIFVNRRFSSWDQSHAQVPVVDMVSEKIWRIYYSSRSIENQSSIGFIEVEAGNPSNILYEHKEPLLPQGPLGSFDENGTMPTCILEISGKKYLYYIGWSVKKSTPYQNSIGLAISVDGGRTFAKYSEGPILGVTDIDPYFTGTFFVLNDSGLFRGYYLSCTGWVLKNDRPEPTYVIKYAESDDGIHWRRDGRLAIGLINENEGAIASASVLRSETKYEMWFSYRNRFGYRTSVKDSYRIGFATSINGVDWRRVAGNPEIDVSPTGWDSEMVAYPYVIACHGTKFLFYNGNGFGKSGFGYAVNK